MPYKVVASMQKLYSLLYSIQSHTRDKGVYNCSLFILQSYCILTYYCTGCIVNNTGFCTLSLTPT